MLLGGECKLVQFCLKLDSYRNGGHINAISYQDYEDLKKALGKEAAQKIILFRLSHLGNLIRIAEKENIITQSQCRKVDYMDVYMDRPYFEENKRKLATFCSDFRAEERESFQVIEEKAEIEVREYIGIICLILKITFGRNCSLLWKHLDV